MSSGFSADAESLKEGGRKDLGALAENLRATRLKIISIDEAGAFTGGESPGQIFANIVPTFREATHYLTRVLDDNIENIELSADALQEIANRYLEADESAAEGLPS